MSKTLTPLASLTPEYSGSVSASAGSGKTWLLVSRIVRLLLAEQAPRHIVAITFTRKAAGEMRQRLNERLLQFVTADDIELDKLLNEIAVTPNAEIIRRARLLYDNLLRQTHSILCTTFHAFCQSLLQSFPLEAEITPGFALVEDASAIQNMSIDSFVNECTQAVNSPLSQALLQLIERFGSQSVCFTALRGFFSKRLDWQLYTWQQPNPAQYASDRLRQHFLLPDGDKQLKNFFTLQKRQALNEYAQLLAQNSATDKTQAETLLQALILASQDNDQDCDTSFEQICRVILTKDKQPRIRKPSGAQAKRLGDIGQQRLLELHQSLAQDLVDELDLQQRLTNFETNRAWYACGQRILEIYQQLKVDQSVLDFDDLEWHTYLLLFQSEAADWVQYRLDSRIDHILVDEFQDTNHFQWRLLHALLDEMSSSDERVRSCFIVGDVKQSIYGFRRAEPALFASASDWLKQAMHAADYPLSTSWRSSPVIMDLVNCVFGDGRLGLANFPQHHTHLKKLCGSVAILPLIEKQTPTPDQESSQPYRNPLLQPRAEDTDLRYYQEGCRMATIINQLTQIGHASNKDILDYNDIMVLVRSRTHIHHYEKAFREANIPYAGGGKANMFECLEIQDIHALLECLVTPYKNLSLAQVLRSPIFNCSENELQHLAGHDISWYETLLQTSWSVNEPALQRAQQQLPYWSHCAATLPTHDAIDIIYHQSDIFDCYQRLAPSHLQGRIRQNLLRVMDMALEIDSGRYPSMEKFIWRLQQIKNADIEEPKDSMQLNSGNSVKILTIHAAKGLESKVVFLADAAYVPRDQSTHQACVKWPVNQETPSHFVLLPSKNERDSISLSLAQTEIQKSEKEQTNLLYVALTRAKQYLYISAVKPTRGEELGWYGAIMEQCRIHEFTNDNGAGIFVEEFLDHSPPSSPATPLKTKKTEARIVQQRPPPTYPKIDITESEAGYAIPSHLDDDADGENDNDYGAVTKGNYIHRALQCLSEGYKAEEIAIFLGSEFSSVTAADTEQWMNESLVSFNHPDLQIVFNHPATIYSYNELPLSYFDHDLNKFVVGIADRIILLAESVLVIDYKTVTLENHAQAKKLAKTFLPQINAYAKALQHIWPEKTVKRYILFTALAQLVEL